MSDEKRLYRAQNNRMVGGVCAGLGDYIGIDPTVIRLLFVLGTFLGVGSLVIVYLVMLLLIPEEPLEIPAVQKGE